MKNIIRLMLAVMVISLLVACNNNTQDDSNRTPSSQDTLTNDEAVDDQDVMGNHAVQQDDQTTIKEKMDALGLAEFELSIDYPDSKDFEVEIEKDTQGNYKVELEDEINNIQLKGIDAFQAVLPSLEKLNITKDTSQEDIINQVINAFELNEDFEEFDIEIIFSDGTKIEFEKKQ